LRAIDGDFVLLAWLHPRAAHWTLDQFAVHGRPAVAQPRGDGELQVQEEAKEARGDVPAPSAQRVLDDRLLPDRTIYHIDLRSRNDPSGIVQEVQRLAAAGSTSPAEWSNLEADSPRRAFRPTPAPIQQPLVIQEATHRRWYPVIDFSRCTNCMECIDFCLFGVYGIDERETIVVEQPDHCRSGCPACSRVCPEQAIIFPQHRTPAIAGDLSASSERKLDLSALFGGPSETELAAQERDDHLRRVDQPPRDTAPTAPDNGPRGDGATRDELDDLIERLDRLDL
jgi:NAD-dependent dihydropyrimidine dehydrogenase PreA subunit